MNLASLKESSLNLEDNVDGRSWGSVKSASYILRNIVAMSVSLTELFNAKWWLTLFYWICFMNTYVITLHLLQIGFIDTHWTNNAPSKHSFVSIGTFCFTWYDLDWLQCHYTVSTSQKVYLNVILSTNFTQYWFQVFPFFGKWKGSLV